MKIPQPELRFSPIAGVTFVLAIVFGYHSVAAGTFAAAAHIFSDYILYRRRRGLSSGRID